MRLDRLELDNFKKFEHAEFVFPHGTSGSADGGSFHVLIGENGSGKSTVLDAAAVAVGRWLVGVPDEAVRTSRPMLESGQHRIVADKSGDRTLFRDAEGGLRVLCNGSMPDGRRFRSSVGRGKSSDGRGKMLAGEVDLAGASAEAFRSAAAAEPVVLPVLRYFGAGRTSPPPKPKKSGKPAAAGRWDACRGCLDPGLRSENLNTWFLREHVEMGNRRGRPRPGFEIVKRAVLRCVPEADDLWYDGDYDSVVMSVAGRPQPLDNLSSGQRTMLGMVGDLAIRMVTLNNFLVPPDRLGDEDGPWPRVLARTPGVVLIDELDVHLHPTWQRGVVESLRTVFPRLQFIATTHSPFIVQTLREGELINLDGQVVPQPGKYGVEKIATDLMGVDRADAGPRYLEMVEVAKDFLRTLDQAAAAPREKLAEYERKLAERLVPYAENPAFQAFLELKRAAKLGSNGHSEATAGNGGER